MTEQSPSTASLALALAGALLMFAGWLLAILPVFRNLRHLWLVVAVAVLVYGLVLVPSSLDIFVTRRGGKRGPGTLAVSLVPAVVIFLILVFAEPLHAVASALAIAIELAGIAIYGWAWWRFAGSS